LNPEVFRGLSELEIHKLFEQLQEQVPAPPPRFQPRLILHQESISGFSPAGDTGNDGVAATSSPRGKLPVPPSLFPKSKEAGSHPQISLPVHRPDTGCGIPVPPFLAKIHSVEWVVFISPGKMVWSASMFSLVTLIISFLFVITGRAYQCSILGYHGYHQLSSSYRIMQVSAAVQRNAR
jgi:hypothetical protein